MKKTKKLFYIITLLIMTLSYTQTFAETKTSYNKDLYSESVLCAVGDITETSVNILVADDDVRSVVFYLDDKVINMSKPNDYGWAMYSVTGLKQNTEHTCYSVVYKNDGTKAYSNINTFKTKMVKTVDITEYKVEKDTIELTALPSKNVGNMYWFLNGEYKGESFSTKVGFGSLKSNTEYKIEVKADRYGNVCDEIIVKTK